MLPEYLDKDLWMDFKRHRTAMKAPLTYKAENLALGKLQKLIDEGYGCKDLIEATILNGWKTFYPLREGHNGVKGNNTGNDNQFLSAIRERAWERP